MTTVLNLIAALGVFVTSLGTLLALVAKFRDRKPIAWLVRRLAIQPAEEVLGRQIDRAIAPLSEKVDSIHHEMHPNSSLSMRDAIDRTEHRVNGIGRKLDEMELRTGRLEGQVDVLIQRR